MWNRKLAECARAYPSGVLTIVGPSGYPMSVRCQAELIDAEEVIRLGALPPTATSWRGKANLLFHRHNHRLEGLHELLIKGELGEHNGVLTLEPTAFVTGTGSATSDALPHAGAPLELLRFILRGQRNARAYLAKRGAPWPRIRFDEVLRVLEEQPTSELGSE